MSQALHQNYHIIKVLSLGPHYPDKNFSEFLPILKKKKKVYLINIDLNKIKKIMNRNHMCEELLVAGNK